MENIQWVFFDIGSTLASEEKAYLHRIRDMTANRKISLEEYLAVRDRYDRQGLDGDAEANKHFQLTKTTWPSEDEFPFEDCEETLKALCERGYKLGIIANQNPGAKERLKAWGIEKYFSVIASSAELGFSKPDLRIFEKALEMAGCRAENAVMVGDRPDNDIAPANKLKMVTIRMKQGRSALKEPKEETEMADQTVESLHEILNILL